MGYDYSLDEETADAGGKSSTLLGFIDAPILDLLAEEEAPTIEDTFIGGQPVWFHAGSRLTDEQLSCGNCGGKLALLLQAFVPLEDATYDRVIYIFSCPDTKQCSKKKGSIRAFRGIEKDPKKMQQMENMINQEMDKKLKAEEKKKMQIELTKDLFSKKDTDAINPFTAKNPFGKTENPFRKTEEEGLKNDNPFKKENNPFNVGGEKVDKEKMNVSAVKEKKKLYSEAAQETKKIEKKNTSKSTLPPIELPQYPGYFVYVKGEKFRNINDPILEKYKHLTEMDVDNEGGSGSGGGNSSGGGKQKDVALDPNAAKVSGMLDDRFFEEFSKKIQHNPSQVLRYERGGTPLLYSGRDSVAAKFLGKSVTIPQPAYNPSSEREFELQLMPKAIMDLESDVVRSASNLLEGMEWGTIIVATDSEDYMPEFDENHVGYVEEWVGVQWEE